MKKYINPQSRTIKLEMESAMLEASNPDLINVGKGTGNITSVFDAETRRLLFDEDDDW